MIALQRIYSFLEHAKYKKEDSGTEIKYYRGSFFGSLTGLTPLRWQTVIQLQVKPNDIFELHYDINTTGQMITELERDYWQQEWKSLSSVIKGNSPADLDPASNNVRASVRRILIGALSISLFMGGISYLVQSFLNCDDRSLFSIVGLFFGLFYFIDREDKRAI